MGKGVALWGKGRGGVGELVILGWFLPQSATEGSSDLVSGFR